ncbi:MAG: hypothetical protein ABI878_09280 [Acidobacteriota bacterium]
MKISKFLLRTAICVLFLALPLSLSAQNSPCQPPEVGVAVYDLVPDQRLQTGEFRPLMKTESGFLAILQETPNISVTDLTTPILPPEIMPESAHISGEMQPPPSQLPDPYFFTGQITKLGEGFLLTVQLRKASNTSLINEVKTPFADPAGAEAAGKTNAAAMIAFLASQAQTGRDDRETSDYAIDPHIDLIIDKLQLKPNETSPVKIVLTDCDGVRLKHRTIEASLQLSHGGTPVQEDTHVRVTDEKGERNGVVAKAPGVITYIAKFTGERYLIRKKSSMAFVFKAKMDPAGGLATDEYNDYNGYGNVLFRRKDITGGDEAEAIEASGLLDQTQSATESLHAGFRIGPAGSEFQASVQNIRFTGSKELFAVHVHPYNYVHETGLEYSEGTGGDGGTTITPQMVKTGVYTFTKTEKTTIDEPENGALRSGGTKGYEIKKMDLEVRRITPGGGIIQR